MKILFVSHRLPYPPNRGAKIRSFNMIAHLSRKHSLVVAGIAHTASEMREAAGLRHYCDEVIDEVLPNSLRWLKAIAALPTAKPSSVAFFECPDLYRKISKRFRGRYFDAIIVSCAFAA